MRRSKSLIAVLAAGLVLTACSGKSTSTTTTGENAAVLGAELGEVRQRVIDRLRRVIDERRGLHRANPLRGRKRLCVRMLSSHRKP